MFRERLGTVGSLGCMVAVLAASVLLGGPRSLLALGLAVSLAVLFQPAAFAIVRSKVLWTFVIVAVLSGALWLGRADEPAGPAGLSLAGAAAGTWMAVRGFAIVLATRGLAASTSPGELAGLLERAGMPGLGFTLGVAVNLLPALERSAHATWNTVRMRGGLRRRRLTMLRLAALTILTNALRRAEEIALAAEARGFGPGRSRPLPLRRGSLDTPVLASLAALVALLAAWRGLR
jgi:energy-coupling factor transporter transmembrane protein EcfT